MRIALVILAVSLIACESDDKKLERLETAKLMDCLDAQAAKRLVGGSYERQNQTTDEASEMAARMQGDTGTANQIARARRAESLAARTPDTLAENWLKAQRKCDLAIREYNRFMR